MKIVFFGTTDFAVHILDSILCAGIEVVSVVTTTDKWGGRGHKELLTSAVKKYAVSKDLPLLQPVSLKGPKFLSKLAALDADLFVVVAFRMLPEVVWSMPPKGTINLHGSLLPAYRGAAPINHAIINGETVTGVTVFKLNKAIDTGDILSQASLDILPSDNFGTLYQKLMQLGGTLMTQTLHQMSLGSISPIPQQDHKASYAPKLTIENTQIDFETDAVHVVNKCRGLSPYPGAWFLFNGKKIKIYECELSHVDIPLNEWDSDFKNWWALGCKEGAVNVITLQEEGKKTMSIKEWLNGNKQKLAAMKQ